ncbi:MAG: type II toxin-antitoxin system HicA family toxin [Phycisphaerae bacterium]|nr:type II toxin-antitoxin system HicA family toxin [Phycisphaerae bacterium]
MPSDRPFREVERLLESKRYLLTRISGSHHVFTKPGARPFPVPVHHGKVKYAYVRKIMKLE